MRDFRDAKAMAHTLRAALATKGLNVTVSQSLELIAQAFGVADWNTLAAAIRQEAPAPRKFASPSPSPTIQFSRELESTLHRALANAKQREHEYATLEHLLLALIDDQDAAAVMRACNVDLDKLRRNLLSYVESELEELVIGGSGDSKPTAGFQRVIQRAVIHVESFGRDEVTGANVLVGIFAERESHAADFLQEQRMTSQDAINFLINSIVKGGGDASV